MHDSPPRQSPARGWPGQQGHILLSQMFRGKAKLALSCEAREWIDQSFVHLVELFGVEWLREAPVVLPTKEFFPKPYEESQDWARDAFERVGTLMRIDPSTVDLEFGQDHWDSLRAKGVFVGATRSALGLYCGPSDPSRFRVVINSSLLRTPEAMVAVMAHGWRTCCSLAVGRFLGRSREWNGSPT